MSFAPFGSADCEVLRFAAALPFSVFGTRRFLQRIRNVFGQCRVHARSGSYSRGSGPKTATGANNPNIERQNHERCCHVHRHGWQACHVGSVVPSRAVIQQKKRGGGS